MLGLSIITIPCPKCKLDLAAFDEEKTGIYVGRCNTCGKTFEISNLNENEILVKEVRIN